MTTKNTFLTILLFISCALSLKGFAQSIYWCDPSIWNTNEHNGSFYAGIGYITGWYNLSTINVTQAGTGNRYSMKNVNGDNRTLDDKLPLDFSYRAGFFFNHRQDMAIELNYDPANFHVVNNQNILYQGTRDNSAANEITPFSMVQGNYYRITGGNVLVNFVKKVNMYRNKMNTVSIDFFAKAGIGPTVAYRVQSAYYEKAADNTSLQVSGWNAGLETAFRGTFHRNFYIEAAPKMDYSMLHNLETADGTASQNIMANEVTLSVGYTFAANRHNPLYRKVAKEHKVITIPDNFIGEQEKVGHGKSNY